MCRRNNNDLHQRREKTASLREPFHEKRISSYESQDAVLSPAMRMTQQSFPVIKQTFHQRIQEAPMKQNIQEAVGNPLQKWYNSKDVQLCPLD